VQRRQFVADGVVDGSRDADPARIGQTFQPRGDIDAVTIDIVSIDVWQ
jgi:hypothetical protein